LPSVIKRHPIRYTIQFRHANHLRHLRNYNKDVSHCCCDDDDNDDDDDDDDDGSGGGGRRGFSCGASYDDDYDDGEDEEDEIPSVIVSITLRFRS